MPVDGREVGHQVPKKSVAGLWVPGGAAFMSGEIYEREKDNETSSFYGTEERFFLFFKNTFIYIQQRVRYLKMLFVHSL